MRGKSLNMKIQEAVKILLHFADNIYSNILNDKIRIRTEGIRGFSAWKHRMVNRLGF